MNKSHILVTASTIALTALVVAELGISTIAFAGGPITGPITAPITGPIVPPVTAPVGTPTPTPTATPIVTPTPRPTSTPKPTHSPKPTSTPRPTSHPKPRRENKFEDLMDRHETESRRTKFYQVIARWFATFFHR